MDDDLKKKWEEAISHMDLLSLMKKVFYDGWDSYEDYIKYGDIFIPLKFTSQQKAV